MEHRKSYTKQKNSMKSSRRNLYDISFLDCALHTSSWIQIEIYFEILDTLGKCRTQAE